MTNTEINESVARKLGKNLTPGCQCGDEACPDPEQEIDVPNYSGSIAAAWELIDKIGPHFNGLHREWDSGDYYVKLSDGALRAGITTGEWYEEGPSDPSPAKAICLAFLKLEVK